MDDGQKYDGKESHATTVEGTAKNANGVPQLKQKAPIGKDGYQKNLWFGDGTAKGSIATSTVTTHSAFGDIMTDPGKVNRLRQDLRAWFTAYVPVANSSDPHPNECDLDESVLHYEILDHFLSALVAEGIDLLMDRAANHE